MTDGRLTQTALEQWAMPNAQARQTQIGAEVWANALAGASQAVMTLVAVEQWANLPATARVALQTAVTVT